VVTALAVGPTQVDLTVDVDKARLESARRPDHAEFEQLVDGGWNRVSWDSDWHVTTHGWGLKIEAPARPRTDETYQVRVEFSGAGAPSGMVTADPVHVRTPAAPTIPPAPPANLRGRPLSPYAVELTWDASAAEPDAPYGFEVSVAMGNDRVTIVRPDARRTEIHGLSPYTAYSFSLRAFNPLGVSTLAGPVAVRTYSGDPPHVKPEHMNAFMAGVRFLRTDGTEGPDIDYFISCRVGTEVQSRADTPIGLVDLAPPFGRVCQVWPDIGTLLP
jgi:hypothetical protein